MKLKVTRVVRSAILIFDCLLIRLPLAVVLLASVSSAVIPPVQAAGLPPAAAQKIDFDRDIQPIFALNCLKCHGPQKSKGGFRLDTREATVAGGDNHAPAILPGKSAESALIKIVAGADPELVMPPDKQGDRLTTQQVGLLRAWIDQGAPWGEATVVSTASTNATPGLDHWAFTAVKRPEIPASGSVARSLKNNPVDHFIRQKLKPHGLDLSAEADRTTLARRLWMVMLGLPPSPEELAAFLKDRRPDAFERLVDQVLNDPRYGERWARHWLDVVRFAESNGFETNRERLSSWRYRDYVIDALNSDKPYDQFIREQIAGDTFGNEIATGFLVAGPVDIVGSPDPVLTAQQRADELDDMVSTTGSAFLGLTLGCARCHSHKFDPISQKEYYSMAAMFAGVKHGERPLPLPAGQKVRAEELSRQITDLEQKLALFLRDGSKRASTSGAALRVPVSARFNEEKFEAITARNVRFVIDASSGGEPCIDELEVWSGTNNVALKSRGARASASGTLAGYEIHKLEHLNDGQTGNSHSWISNESGRGWVQLEFPQPVSIDRIVWSRDRNGNFQDRVATSYRIEALVEGGGVRKLASSEDRQPFSGAQPKAPVYAFDGFPEATASQGRAWLKELEQVKKERDGVAKPPTTYSGNFVQPGDTHRLHRGDPMQKRELVAPATLALFSPVSLALQEPEKNRRARLAEWITSKSNPLTARVLVNRVWQHQFGVGLVDTPNDFGINGSRPTHPELLDLLAHEFMAGGWSIKKLQRQILLSATWRQSSAPRAEGLSVDAASRLLWRFPPRRIEAEGIRDSILAASGSLNPKRGGPAFYLHDVDRENVYHYHPKEKFGPDESRRMIYAFKVRMEQDGIFGAFDCPDGSLVAPKRSVSTTPLQALNLFNSRFLLDQAGIFAGRLKREAGVKASRQVERAWQLAYNRSPSRKELKDAVAFVDAHGLPSLCRAVLNSSEFVFIP